ncbi:MAG: hypothetical protein RL322_1290 [Pseudomonadota bacterium]|jgi:signal transduction histidine kinase/CheY-like chemotaxis protein
MASPLKLRPADRTTPDAASLPDRGLAHRLLWDRCRYQARQTLFEPPLLLALIIVVVVAIEDPPSRFTMPAWAGLLSLTLSLRLWIALSILQQRMPRHAEAAAALLRVSTGLTGLLLGASASLLFATASGPERLLITFSLGVWLGPAVVIHAAFRKHARLHGGLIVGQLALAWWLNDPEHGGLWAISLIVVAVFLERLAGHLSRTLALAQHGRHERRTLLRRLALETRQAREAGATASRFLAAASHDLRQPATALSLMSSLLLERCTDPALRPLTEGISRSCQALNDLLGNLLDLSRLEAGIIQPDRHWHRVDPLLDDLRLEFGLRARAKGLDLYVGPCVGEVFTDRILLMRILRNILENALRYTDHGTIQLTAHDEAGLRLTVSDTGVGIPETLRERLQSSADGTLDGSALVSRRNGLGIGLALVHRIGRLLGTTLQVESDGSSWTRVSLQIPPQDRRVVPIEPSQDPQVEPNKEACLDEDTARAPRLALLVEDDETVAQAIRRILEFKGYRVQHAATAHEAMSHLSGADPFDLILSDFNLGGPLDGIDLLSRARLLQPGSRCILATADTRPQTLTRVRQTGLEYLLKPLHPDTLG